jgi:Asp-tRNA(Asn)/Glu-tRNA(Gln) amidotransferase A subunit family amidase
MSDDELHFASTGHARRARADAKVSSLEIVEACLRRIDAVNPRLNAVVHLAGGRDPGGRQADAELRDGIVRGRCGLPFTIKDSLDTAGIVSTAGTIGWRDRVPSATRDGRSPPPRRWSHPARQDEHTGVHGPTQPTTTSMAGRTTPT